MFAKRYHVNHSIQEKNALLVHFLSLEARLSEVPPNNYNIEDIVCKALEILCLLDILYNNGTIEEKRKIISSIFLEKLTFDGAHYRTTRINKAANLIYTLEQRLSKKNGTNLLKKEDLYRG